MISHYEDTMSNTFFIQLINLKQKSSVVEHIENFQRLNIKITYIPDENLIDVFIRTLKDNIQHEFHLWEPNTLENAFRVARNVESKNLAMATRRTTLTSIERIMFLLLNHLNNLTKENQKVYILIVTTSIVRDIIVVRRNHSTYIVKRKKKKNKNHLKMKM
jgi:hypothetical protein